MQLFQIFKIIFIAILISVLSACGGGSSKENPPSAQALSFTQIGPLNLSAGDVLTNTATGEGSGAITYSSNNKDVATVNGNGIVTIVGAGDAVITANKAGDAKFLAATASYTIHAVSIEQVFNFEQVGTINLLAGDTLNNPAKGQGGGTITYTSSNPSVATVDNNGVVTAVVIGAGSAIITAEIAADPHYLAASASYTVSATGINQTFLFNNPLQSFGKLVGENFTNQAVGQGTGAVSYYSTNTNVADVDANGLVTIVGGGFTEIIAYKSADNHYLSANTSYVIYAQAMYFGQLGPISSFVGASLNNQANAQGNGVLTYESNNPNVATVDNTGFVTLVGAGSAVISATKATDGNYVAVSAQYTLNVTRLAQAINFTQAGPINLLVGESITNVAAGQGSGTISYSSSDTSIATVDSAGVVNLIGPGKVVITANISADTKYLASNASYTINSGISLTAWVGSQDTLVNFSAAATGFEFYRSSANGCDITAYSSCVDGQFNLLVGSVVTDTAATVNRSGYYVIKNGSRQAELTLKVDINDVSNGIYAQFTNRNGHQIVIFNNKLWLIGGSINNGNGRKNDVWSSSDGVNWKEEIANAAFSARYGHQVLVYANKLWLIGGTADTVDGLKTVKDVWSSTDGIVWTKQSDGAAFTSVGGTAVVYNNKLWVIGGYNNGYTNDVWSSTDGINWTQEIAHAAFTARSGHQVVEFKNQLWLIGGIADQGFSNIWFNDIWSSTDGVNWISQTASADFSVRVTSVLEYNNKLWLIGGSSGQGKKNDVWSSSDGVSWALQTANAPFTPRVGSRVLNYNNQILLFGGNDENGSTYGDYTNDVWSSINGIEWRVGYRGVFQIQ